MEFLIQRILRIFLHVRYLISTHLPSTLKMSEICTFKLLFHWDHVKNDSQRISILLGVKALIIVEIIIS